MPYDESTTVETPNGKFANQMTSGRAMLPRYKGEKSLYDTAEEADQAAASRSQFEYDELRRDPANQWAMPDTPAPPLLDMPGQSMHQAPAIGKKASMQDPDSIINTIQGGLNAMRFDSLLKGSFDQKAHQERIMTTGPAAAANDRQKNWAPMGAADPSFVSPVALPAAGDPHGEKTSLVAADATQGINDMVAQHGAKSSGMVMGAAGTEYDKKANPILMAHASVGGEGNASAKSQLKILAEEEARSAAATGRGQQVQQVPGSPITPLWTPDQIKSRIPAPRSNKPAAVDPYEGMDPELKAAVIAEEKRNRRR